MPTNTLAMKMLKMNRSHQSNMYNALVTLYCVRESRCREREREGKKGKVSE